MILRIVLFGMILCGLGGFGTIVWLIVPHSAASAAGVIPAKTAVLVAAKPLHPGTLLQPEDLTGSEIDTGKMPAGAVLADADTKRSLIGGLVLHQIQQGDVLRVPGDALRPTDHGFLAAVLSPGKVAVTVGVDVVSGAAGLIWPGDNVDVILTQTIDGAAVAPGRRVVAETILEDTRVIAIDQQITQGSPHNSGDSVAKTVTLEVTPGQAESVQVANRLGRLSLTLRSAASQPSEATQRPKWASDVSAALPSQAKPAVVDTIRVFQGAGDSKEFKF
jgi:pilus assembly protein CpaB